MSVPAPLPGRFLDSLGEMLRSGVFFLSRCRHRTALFTGDGRRPLDLLKELRRRGALELDVLLGADANMTNANAATMSSAFSHST